MNERLVRLRNADPISQMLRVVIIGLALGVAIFAVRVIPYLPGVWADSAVWRVHHAPALSTQQERFDVARIDELMMLIGEVRRQAQQAYSR